MKIRISLFVLCISFLLNAQPRPPQFVFLFQEVNFFPSGLSETKINYSFRLPYNRIVFIKEGAFYKAGFQLSLEAADSTGKVILREFTSGSIKVDNFKDTDAGDKYYQGFISFTLRKGSYTFTPVLSDENSEGDRKLSELTLNTEENRFKDVLPALVINGTCNGNGSLKLANYESNIPLTQKGMSIYFPLRDSNTVIEKIIVSNNEDTIYTGSPDGTAYLHSALDTCSGNLLLSSSNTGRYKSYYMEIVVPKLKEGLASFHLFTKNSIRPLKTVHMNVQWYDKPIALINPEVAIKMMKYIVSEPTVDSLLRFSEKEYLMVLNRYWERLDPTPTTAYNELMNEYYERVDYAAQNFSSINGRKGFDTDRGMIYIQFGKPWKIERGSNTFGKVTEKWIYDKDDKVFIFVDKTGTGEYKLERS